MYILIYIYRNIETTPGLTLLLTIHIMQFYDKGNQWIEYYTGSNNKIENGNINTHITATKNKYTNMINLLSVLFARRTKCPLTVSINFSHAQSCLLPWKLKRVFIVG